MVYARDTNVSVNRTREEIIATLERYGDDAFGYAKDGNREAVFFRMEGRLYAHRVRGSRDDGRHQAPLPTVEGRGMYAFPDGI